MPFFGGECRWWWGTFAKFTSRVASQPACFRSPMSSDPTLTQRQGRQAPMHNAAAFADAHVQRAEVDRFTNAGGHMTNYEFRFDRSVIIGLPFFSALVRLLQAILRPGEREQTTPTTDATSQLPDASPLCSDMDVDSEHGDLPRSGGSPVGNLTL